MMKKYLILIFLGALAAGFFWTGGILAQGDCGPSSAREDCGVCQYDPKPVPEASDAVTFIMGPATSGNTYWIEADCPGVLPPSQFSPDLTPSGGSVSHTFQRSAAACIFSRGTHKLSLWRVGAGSPICSNTYEVVTQCDLEVLSSTTPDTDDVITVSGSSVPREANRIFVKRADGSLYKDVGISVGPENTFVVSIGTVDTSGWYAIEVVQVTRAGGPGHNVGCPAVNIYVYQAGGPTPTPGPVSPGEPGYFDPCWDDESGLIGACQSCLGGPLGKADQPREGEADNTWTALGCIPNDPAEFVAWILARAVGVGGGIAFLLMLWGGFQIITSSGDPQKLNDGKDILVSAVAGLLFIIFSLFLLRIVGVDILGLPGFNP